ncbi:hypothetical protein [Spiroplasma tabanidicola]|uniref:Uncharacterized protein n=1 Tax=Spiroplasma tabanidicola TaxID=324079 RepID=A0A6I6C4J5_9MOLU|nr:hypothetical protein [Spiroplasma tabanidicola]QGS51717.1 hypothetical protein STABA_v1c03540 [Spiroplasma tabanidicola]
MADISRMERNKELHNKIRLEIAQKKQKQDEKSLIYTTFERLKLIDGEYFKEKLDYFDKKHQIEKPYLDKDKSNSLISEDIRFQIKREIAELKKIKPIDYDKKPQKTEMNEEIEIKSAKFLKYYNNLVANEKVFYDNIEKFKVKQKILKDPSHDISMTTVQQVRNSDTRSTNIMIKSVEDRLEAGQKTLNKVWATYDKKRRFKNITWFFIVLILMMIIALIIPFFL